MIKQLDEGIELKKYKYSNHSLAIRKWKEKDRGTPIPKQIKGQEKKIYPSCGLERAPVFTRLSQVTQRKKWRPHFEKTSIPTWKDRY